MNLPDTIAFYAAVGLCSILAAYLIVRLLRAAFAVGRIERLQKAQAPITTESRRAVADMLGKIYAELNRIRQDAPRRDRKLPHGYELMAYSVGKEWPFNGRPWMFANDVSLQVFQGNDPEEMPLDPQQKVWVLSDKVALLRGDSPVATETTTVKKPCVISCTWCGKEICRDKSIHEGRRLSLVHVQDCSQSPYGLLSSRVGHLEESLESLRSYIKTRPAAGSDVADLAARLEALDASVEELIGGHEKRINDTANQVHTLQKFCDNFTIDSGRLKALEDGHAAVAAQVREHTLKVRNLTARVDAIKPTIRSQRKAAAQA